MKSSPCSATHTHVTNITDPRRDRAIAAIDIDSRGHKLVGINSNPSQAHIKKPMQMLTSGVAAVVGDPLVWVVCAWCPCVNGYNYRCWLAADAAGSTDAATPRCVVSGPSPSQTACCCARVTEKRTFFVNTCRPHSSWTISGVRLARITVWTTSQLTIYIDAVNVERRRRRQRRRRRHCRPCSACPLSKHACRKRERACAARNNKHSSREHACVPLGVRDPTTHRSHAHEFSILGVIVIIAHARTHAAHVCGCGRCTYLLCAPRT